MVWIVIVLLFAASMLLGVAAAYRFGPRMGIDMQCLTPAKKRHLAIMLSAGGAVALLIVWALATGHVAIGIGLLLAVTVLPELVLVPLRIKRARRKAEESRAARRARRS
jgi:ABC-type transport system involved in cytochrome bd biosynthesis fused ATPase/permease subunit